LKSTENSGEGKRRSFVYRKRD